MSNYQKVKEWRLKNKEKDLNDDNDFNLPL